MNAFNTAVTFYEAPLVCHAAPSIGCGNKAKVMLVELEQNKVAVGKQSSDALHCLLRQVFWKGKQMILCIFSFPLQLLICSWSAKSLIQVLSFME